MRKWWTVAGMMVSYQHNMIAPRWQQKLRMVILDRPGLRRLFCMCIPFFSSKCPISAVLLICQVIWWYIGYSEGAGFYTKTKTIWLSVRHYIFWGGRKWKSFGPETVKEAFRETAASYDLDTPPKANGWNLKKIGPLEQEKKIHLTGGGLKYCVFSILTCAYFFEWVGKKEHTNN